jgi:hypothetical protein
MHKAKFVIEKIASEELGRMSIRHILEIVCLVISFVLGRTNKVRDLGPLIIAGLCRLAEEISPILHFLSGA